MSTVSEQTSGDEQVSGEEQTSGELAIPSEDPSGRARKRRWKLAAVVIGVVIIGGALTLGVTDPFKGSSSSGNQGVAATGTASVTNQSLSSQTQVSATLGYANSYNVVVPAASSGAGGTAAGAAQGTTAGQSGASAGSQSQGGSGMFFTALPALGKVIRQGQSLYSLNGSAVVLLYSTSPAYRSLSEGMTGADVKSLNADLVALGYATRSELNPKSNYFSAATATALRKLQAKLGLSQTGSLALGQAVFLPGAVRVTTVSATLGAPAQVGSQVLQVSSNQRQVVAQIDATLQSDVKTGDAVTITLPNNQTTPGVVTSVGTVATNPSASSNSGSGSSGSTSSSSSGSSGSSGGTATIEVDINPTNTAATGTLDSAPVQVTITTATVNHATVVPVDALLARASGGYAVEVAGANGARHLVPVSLGIFDDADGLVQVISSQLSAGQKVVVPKL